VTRRSTGLDYSSLFDEDYLYSYKPRLEEVSYADAGVIWRLLQLERGMDVLDLACGHGRIANRLAERRARVTGLDAAPLFLKHAREAATSRGLEVNYVEGDMRSLPWADASFDCAISWFTSFAYFGDDSHFPCECSSPWSCVTGCSSWFCRR
jgi:cyclopropane fatty-acyl-phospholipid synthase-like methyltransferase